jgi:hypothetical protein
MLLSLPMLQDKKKNERAHRSLRFQCGLSPGQLVDVELGKVGYGQDLTKESESACNREFLYLW